MMRQGLFSPSFPLPSKGSHWLSDEDLLLKSSAEGDKIYVTKLLYAKRVNPNIKDKDDCTPIYYAVTKGHTPIVAALIEKGAYFNSEITYGSSNSSLLHLAVLDNHFEIVKLLLEKGASSSIAEKDGTTPLHYAAYNGFKGITELLLQHNASISAESGRLATPIDAATKGIHGKAHEEIISILQNASSKISYKPKI
jgi:ankyrin repeat protein